MNRGELISQLSNYFSVEELVCDHTYTKWGEMSWQFLDTNYLHCLLIIRRDILQMPMVCNGGAIKQRGLRCNLCTLVKEKETVYLSSHILGKAGDFSITGMSAEEARRKIKASSSMLPCNIRIEADVTWLHFDVLPQIGIKEKVYEFEG